MAVTLYYTPGACSLAIHALLIATKVEYKLAKVILSDKVLEDGSDYLKINSNGSVPALGLENGEILTQGLAISTYIASISNVESLKISALSSLREIRYLEAACDCSDLQSAVVSVFMGLEGKAKETFDGKIHRVVGRLDGKFAARSTKFWLGEEPTYPDYLFTTILRWADMYKFDISQYKNVEKLRGEVAASPAFAQALKEEGL